MSFPQYVLPPKSKSKEQLSIVDSNSSKKKTKEKSSSVIVHSGMPLYMYID